MRKFRIEMQERYQKELRDRLAGSDYNDISDFVRRSGLNKFVTPETVRRVFNDNTKPCHCLTLALVARFLDFEQAYIETMIRDLGGEEYLLILKTEQKGREGKLTARQENLLACIDKIETHSGKSISSVLSSVAELAGIDVTEFTEPIRRDDRKRKTPQRMLQSLRMTKTTLGMAGMTPEGVKDALPVTRRESGKDDIPETHTYSEPQGSSRKIQKD